MLLTIHDVLAREHEKFFHLLKKLEWELNRPKPIAREHINLALKIILSDIDRHEELEEIVYSSVKKSSLGNKTDVRQREVHALREKILEALESFDMYTHEELHDLTVDLIASLRMHIENEELYDWPLHREVLNQSMSDDLHSILNQRARFLEQELRRSQVLIAASFH